MRPSRLWNTYRMVRLERYLGTVPRAERKTVKSFLSGKWVR